MIRLQKKSNQSIMLIRRWTNETVTHTKLGPFSLLCVQVAWS